MSISTARLLKNEEFKEMIEKSKPAGYNGTNAERLTIEYFIEDYHKETEWISQEIVKRNQKGKKPLKAKSYFQHLDGTVEQLLVDVVEYDEAIKKFYVLYKVPDT